MLVKKANADPNKPLLEQYRVVNDFRKLNANTVKDSYPMRNIYDLIEQVAAARVATVIDLRSAFFVQQLTENSRQYTSFPVPGRGLFEYCRSPQGLINSPSAFQRLLDHIMCDIPNVKVYIDDIVIYNDTFQDHLITLNKVLERLQHHNFKCSVKKLQLAKGTIHYLGYEIKPGHYIRPGIAKTQAIANWKPPADVSQIRQFLGLCGFFRRTINRYAEMAAPLTKLTRNDSDYKSGPLPPLALTAFRNLQTALTSRPVLRPPLPNLPFILTTDASTTALGAVLTQKHSDNTEHPIAYYSRTLNDAERKYAPFHLEYLAMQQACKHFRPYLTGVKFTIRTDHKPLLALNKTNGQQMDRIRLELAEYDYDVIHMKGSQMIADGLSRQHTVAPVTSTSAPDISKSTAFPPISTQQLQDWQKADVHCKALICAMRFQSYPFDPDLRRFVNTHIPRSSIRNNILYLDRLIYAPFALRNWLLHMSHDAPLAGHLSVDKTYHRISLAYTWPGLKADIARYIANCHTCNRNNAPHHNTHEPLQPLPTATKPFETVHIDLLQLPLSPEGLKYALVMVDSFTRFVELAPIANKDSKTVATAVITSWICRHGTPDNFHSDLGSEFTNDLFKTLCNDLQIKNIYTTAGHPAGNGKVERVNRTVIQFLRKYLENKNAWPQLLPYAAFSINTSTHTATGLSPYYMLHFNEPHLPANIFEPTKHLPDKHILRNMQLAYSTAAENTPIQFQQAKKTHDARIHTQDLHINDKVYLHTTSNPIHGKKLNPAFAGPYFIVGLPTAVHVDIRRNNSAKVVRVHRERLKIIPYARFALQPKPTAISSQSPDQPLPANNPPTKPNTTQPPPPPPATPSVTRNSQQPSQALTPSSAQHPSQPAALAQPAQPARNPTLIDSPPPSTPPIPTPTVAQQRPTRQRQAPKWHRDYDTSACSSSSPTLHPSPTHQSPGTARYATYALNQGKFISSQHIINTTSAASELSKALAHSYTYIPRSI